MVSLPSLTCCVVCVLLVTLSSLCAVDVYSTGLSLDTFTFYGDAKPETVDEFSKAHAHFQSHLKTGTTIVGICCSDGIVLGADTRSTGGPLVMDKNKLKIHTVAHKIRCCAAGTSADCDQITRKAKHFLGLVRIEQELAGESDITDCVQTAVTNIANNIQSSISTTNGNARKVQSVLILGGVDAQGPALYQIDAEGVPQRIGFGALGSGSTDALAILEHARRDWLRNSTTSNANSNIKYSNSQPYREGINTTSAVSVVRRAVQAGILNDLGSGGHVDLCVITADEVKQWRETLVSSWDADRLPSHQNAHKNTDNTAAHAADFVMSHTVTAATSASTKLGRRVFRRLRPIRRLVNGKILESDSVGVVDDNLAFNVEHLVP